MRARATFPERPLPRWRWRAALPRSEPRKTDSEVRPCEHDAYRMSKESTRTRILHFFEVELPAAVIEGAARRGLDQLDSLALTKASMFERAMVAVRVVTGPSEKRGRHPGAAGPAFVGVVAGSAVAPEIASRTIAIVTERR